MILQLLTNVYNDSNIYRNDELKFCLQQNCIAGFDRYHFFIDTKTLAGSYLPKKSYIHISSKRPTFKDFFQQMDDDAINIMANSDIVFKPETLAAIRNFYENCEDKEHTCLALSRWDVDANDRAVHFDRHDSQDTWIFYGKPKFTGYADFNLGKAGCLHGDTIIRYNRGKRSGTRDIKLSDFYEKFNGFKKDFDLKIPTNLWSIDIDENKPVYNKVEAVIQSGIKKTIKITLEDGSFLQLTEEHPILTSGNVFKMAQDLKVDDLVVCIGSMKSIKSASKKKQSYRKLVYIKYHPFAENKIVRGHKYKRVRKGRLVYEANMNNLNYEDYIDILNNNEEKSKKLIFLDPKLEIHHKDDNHQNDELYNLEVLTKEEHAKHHINDRLKTSLKKDYLCIKKVVSIEDCEEVMTYDISMSQPFNNFLANGIFVHNCDNRIAHELAQSGFKVINNSKTIKTYHYHNSNIRNYLDETGRAIETIPPPYLLIPTTY